MTGVQTCALPICGFFFWYKPEQRGPLKATLKRLGLDEAAAKLLGGQSAKNDMLAERERPSAPQPRAPKAGKPWFRQGRRG